MSSFSFSVPWARAHADSVAPSSLDTGSVFAFEAAPPKLPSLRQPAAPTTDKNFSFPSTVQASPRKLFSRETPHHTHRPDDSHPVSNSSASISEGFDTSSDDDDGGVVSLSAPRPPVLRPPAPRLSPLLSTTDSALGFASAAPRCLEAAALVAALGRHTLHLRSALIILGYQDLWPTEHEIYRSVEGTLASVLALARRAGAQPHELTPHFLLTLLWLLHSFDNQVGGWASDVAQRFTVLLPSQDRASARAALQKDMIDLQGPLLERCGWRLRLTAGEVGLALAELRGCPDFQPWCTAAHMELAKLLTKRPPRVQSPVVVEPLSKFEAGAPIEAATVAKDKLGQARPSVALGPSALLGSQSSAFMPVFPGFPVPGVQAAARGEDGGRQAWRKRLRGVDSTSELPNKQAQRVSMASRFHSALRGMFGGGSSGQTKVQTDPFPGEYDGAFEAKDFTEE